MPRRLEIELTSKRPDGTWTWRAAGAKQPKGDLRSEVLPTGCEVGDVVRADAEFELEGIEILSVLPPKAARKEPDMLTVIGTRQDEPLVTTTYVEKSGRSRDGGGGRKDRGERGDRGPRGDRPGGRDGAQRKGRTDGDRPRSDRPDGDRSRSDRPRNDRPGGDRSRGPRPDAVPERPRPKRLRPGRTHRSAVLDTLPVEHRPIAEQVIRGGVPAVREAIAEQNALAKKENRPEIPSEQLIALAEQLLPQLRAAEWLDRAEAALADLDELDLRDLRSVIVAADGVARDEAALTMKDQIQAGLTRRIEEEQTLWISDMTANLDAGRFVRALRLSSRPPKAGAPLPVEVSSRLVAAVSEGLTPTVNQDLWAAALDALAFSPVRNLVTPTGAPEEPSPALLDAVRRVGDRLPNMVLLFGLDPAEVAAASKKRGRSGPRGPQSGAAKSAQTKSKADKSQDSKPVDATAETAAEETTAEETVAVETVAEETATEATTTEATTEATAESVTEVPAAEEPAAEEPAAEEPQ
ncbi:MAG: hypothetical protein WD029_01290 [Microthrixaceae bacterium]